jgi:hypothetical protein
MIGVLAAGLLAVAGCSSGGEQGSGSRAVPPNGVPEEGPGTGGSGSLSTPPGGEMRANGTRAEDTVKTGAEARRGEDTTAETFAGTLAEKSGNDFSVQAGRQTMPFKLDAVTKISKGAEPVDFDTLRPGDALQLRYHKEGNLNVASEINVTPAPRR